VAEKGGSEIRAKIVLLESGDGDFHNSDCPVFKFGDFNRYDGDVPQNSH